jgi:cyclophilin family peptidyl-prolyl cis-trans isomerase
MYSKQSSFTVNGTDLSGVNVTALGACSSLTESAGGSATTRTFSCTPTFVGTLSIFVTIDGNTLKLTSFSVPNPQVTFITSMGNILVELYPAKAPITANNFLRYVNEGFYTNTIFHRVMSGFVVQGGGFGTDGVQKTPTHPAIFLELPSATGLTNSQGTIAMARATDLNSATSQFFFNTVNNTGLDTGSGGYAAFGSVIQGFDVVKAIEAVPVSATDNKPLTNVVVTSATQTK